LTVFLSSRISALRLRGDLPAQVALGHRGRDVGDVPHLVGQVRRHPIDRVRQVLPRPGDAGHVGLTAQHPLRADISRHAGHFVGERGQLIHHRIDGVLELQDLPLRFGGDLLGEIALRDGGGDVGDVAHLVGQVRGHPVH
jgi:hypothetical protein